MSKISYCGCGHGKATHEHPNFPGELRIHILGVGTCAREEVPGLGDKLKFFKGKLFPHWEKDVDLVNLDGEIITLYTFRFQRMYSFHEDSGVWSRPKSKESVNSLEGDW